MSTTLVFPAGSTCDMTAREDYSKLLDEVGLPAEFLAAMAQSEDDLVAMPIGPSKVRVGPSMIHGNGVFSVQSIAAGECIGAAGVDGMRTPIGRNTNHSGAPNARGEPSADGGVNLFALAPIVAGEEVTIDYRELCRYSGVRWGPAASAAAAEFMSWRGMPEASGVNSFLIEATKAIGYLPSDLIRLFIRPVEA